MSRRKFGYLLKDRVFDVGDFLDALRRVAADGSILARVLSAQAIGILACTQK
ncbi:hypothetical protein [Streptosporangium sp. 'caverna']|uniref:hypothetical protein n=1 Tax=Streptosporangium sp. 'caverna' TaxID=2202249 RepID=UPI00195508C2|nr:hypothetical protein [Streptosporangium sp. 'caverna']